MDPAFPFRLPPEPELLALAYAADRTEVVQGFIEACKRGELHLVWRLAAVFELTAESRLGARALGLACVHDHPELARWLADRFRHIDVYDGRLLVRVCGAGHVEMARWLVRRFGSSIGNVRAAENLALRCACGNGHQGTVCWMVGHFGLTPADARAFACHALLGACVFGHLGLARWLAARFDLGRADVRPNGRWILRRARKNGHRAVVRWLVSFLKPPARLATALGRPGSQSSQLPAHAPYRPLYRAARD
jgi:hypothetical protein